MADHFLVRNVMPMAAEASRDSPDRKPTRGLPGPHRRIRHLLEAYDDLPHRAKNILTGVMARISILAMDERVPDDVSDELSEIAGTCLEAGELVDAMARELKRTKAG